MIKKILKEIYPIVGISLALSVIISGGLYWAAKNSGWI